MSSQPNPINQTNPTFIGEFDAAYLAHQPPAIQHLMAMPVDGPTQNDLAGQFQARLATAQGLAAQGYLIDSIIMVYGWDPYWAMFYRLAWGIQSTYLGTATPIPNSTNIADFPPFVAPAPPSTGSTSLVGPDLGNGFYGINGDVSGLSDGEPYPDPNGRGTFTFHRASNPMGVSQWFTKAS